MANMLADVIDAGTASRARAMGFTLPAAGKTGTTNDFVDAWFIGFTPKIVAGVWIGFDRPRTIVKNGFAGELAVPLWTRFMRVATRQDAKAWFQPPPGVVPVQVCRISGLLPVEGCKNAPSQNASGEIRYKNMVYTEYFVRGSEPQLACTVHAAQALPYSEPYLNVGGIDAVGHMVEEPPPAPASLPAAAFPSSPPVFPSPPPPRPSSPIDPPEVQLPAAPPEPPPNP
jgi:membrane peptidoglycan carboxypeptidase